MEDKQHIIMLTHGGWGEELLKSIRMILGKVENVSEVPLMPVDTLTEYMEKVKEKIQSCSGKALILTDIVGGTTSNVALSLKREHDIQIITGLNTALLMESIMRQSSPYTDEVIEEIRLSSLENCKVLSL